MPEPSPRDATDPVAEAMRRRERTDFLPESQRAAAERDAPVPIGHSQTNSQPSTVAAMLRLLDVRPGQHVLDVGSGSGWTTVLLGDLVGRAGWVLGVERVPELVTAARSAIERHGQSWVTVRRADPDLLGAPDHAPFDRVLVSAEAGELPEELVDQLAPEGVMVLPVAGVMTRVVRGPSGTEITRHGHYRFVPLLTGP